MLTIHHLSSLGMLVYCLVRGRYSNIIVWGLVAGEVSNPFLIVRKNLDWVEKFPTTSFCSGFFFALLFLLARQINQVLHWSGIYLELIRGIIGSLYQSVRGSPVAPESQLVLPNSQPSG